MYLPHQVYFDSGQWWRDIVVYLTYLSATFIGLFLMGFCLYQCREALWEKKKKEEYKKELGLKRIVWAAEEAAQHAKEIKERRDKIRREREYAQFQEEKERKEEEDKRIFQQEVQELIAFKRKYGLDALPYNKKHSQNAVYEAYQKLRAEIRWAKILAEEQEEARKFYLIYSWQAVPRGWHSGMCDEKLVIWEKERQKAKKSKKDKGNARLLKALEKLDGHKNS
ncbi:MAG: hypothetical protein AABX82_08195 [Nanoarchaeota archaeon]